MTVPSKLEESSQAILDWCQEIKSLDVRANAEAAETEPAYNKGARGVGLFRTEHMFLGDRLLDAPLHEFFPHNSGLKQEENPMLGHRSVRMAITNPKIPEMQIKAVWDAAAELIPFSRDDADHFLPRHLYP